MISLLLLSLLGQAFSCGTIQENPKTPLRGGSSANFIHVMKQYDYNGLHYTLSVVDSTNKYASVFARCGKVVPISKRRTAGLIRPVLYTLRRRNVSVQVMQLEIMKSCYEKYNTLDGWIAIRDSQQLLKIEGLGDLVHRMDVDIGNNATVRKEAFDGFLCEDPEVQELLDCSEEYQQMMDLILKANPKQK